MMMPNVRRLLLLLLVMGALGVGFQAISAFPGSYNLGDSLAYASASAPQAETPSEAAPQHGDPYARIFLILAILLICAMAGHFVASKLNQSAVLGELAMGILVGALFYQLSAPTVTILRHSDQVAAATQKVLQQNVGWQEAVRLTLAEAKLPSEEKAQIQAVVASPQFPQYLLAARILHFFSSFGVVLLLFMAGLESTLDQLRRAGKAVAGLGFAEVSLTFVSCYAVTWLLLPPGQSPTLPLLIAGALSATSVGISARSFQDMNKLGLPEAQVVLGAAVLDDILSLIILAVVTGILTTGAVALSTIALIVLKAVVFFAAVAWFGIKFLQKDIALVARLDQSQVKLYFSFGLLLVLAWPADLMGLASIIGAFAAGLILEDRYFQIDMKSPEGEQSVGSLLAPLEHLFAPLFFVLLGFQVDVTTFADLKVLVLGLLLTLVAIFGKMAATLILKKGYHKLVVGFGLVPRGEVTLIFASLGKAMGVLSTSLYSVLIIVVLLTTLITPPCLTWALGRSDETGSNER
ncbi:MAG: cation:proton antiporter [Deltaproteobacteria bacterium]|nr:cation:proton antiporter [Deltaproteobacteria bacterium]